MESPWILALVGMVTVLVTLSVLWALCRATTFGVTWTTRLRERRSAPVRPREAPDGVPPERIAVLAAAAVVALGAPVRVRRVRLLPVAPETLDWAEAGKDEAFRGRRPGDAAQIGTSAGGPRMRPGVSVGSGSGA